MDILKLMLAPLAMCLVLTGIHCYLGLHIVSRGVIFVDLALAQIAAFGTAVALLVGFEAATSGSYIISLLFTFVGAGIFSFSRVREKDVPQEAIIGIVYVVFSAAAILILEKAPHGHEVMRTMLIGSVLYTTWPQVMHILGLYLAIGVFHFIMRKKFFLVSMNVDEARRQGLSIPYLDFLFYMTLGFVVTSSVKVAGVLLVFSYLVVPAVCAMLLVKRIIHRLILGWGIGLVVSVLGLYVSCQWDLPTGASIVTTFGVALIVSSLLSFILHIKHKEIV
ncbi:MAG: iron chelate uptake ABC transporter family permease subunit [Candidatus Ancaeobacter aquaticus]|nr:iron chelate uptake ABC transporter family permease subunit [Candidatus Ancaeobacter aquaticus]